MVPEAGIEPARPYERGILSPEGKSIRARLLIDFQGRNYPLIGAMKANVSACPQKIAARKKPSFKFENTHSAQPANHQRYADYA
jgi:hypothetical protein